MKESGFTLIEMSIVLMIIGLIVGGILTGRDLINTAAQRAQITQIETYNTAVRTFQLKYGYLPGDIPNPVASNFGFITRGSFAAEGDGNGIIAGSDGDPTITWGWVEGVGETGVFWVDLSTAGLVDGGFNTAQEHNTPGGGVTNIAAWFPPAKIGRGNYIYVWSGGASTTDGINYWGISAVTKIETSPCDWCLNSTPGLTVQEAYNIDKKIDDSLPLKGKVRTLYLQEWVQWPAGGGQNGTSNNAATPASSTTCYDNGNVNNATQQYSMAQNGGLGLNCALSFQFQ